MFKQFFNKFQNQVKKDTKIINEQKNHDQEIKQQKQVEIFAPKSREEIMVIANSMLKGTICHVNFNKFSETDKQKYIFFLLGVIHAIDGKPTKVNSDQFIFTSK